MQSTSPKLLRIALALIIAVALLYTSRGLYSAYYAEYTLSPKYSASVTLYGMQAIYRGLADAFLGLMIASPCLTELGFNKRMGLGLAAVSGVAALILMVLSFQG